MKTPYAFFYEHAGKFRAISEIFPSVAEFYKSAVGHLATDKYIEYLGD